ncbi:MAG TPA: rRNA maturation RNase YbeY [Burkholderiales bacterium]|nr:rRNA maturation RNase YbeY [Burkholderiales bacterium]
MQFGIHPDDAPTRTQLRRWASAALQGDAEVTLRLIDEVEGEALNGGFRGRHHATNVLTFAYSEQAPYHGDIALCAPVVSREARTQRKSIEAHYAHLVVHGMLHLQGYDHQTASEAAVMEQLESRIVAALGYPDPYGKDEGKRKDEG